MKRKFTMLFICLPFIIQAQGIKFEEGLSWQQILAKAKLEHKAIFMDCYATWCGPCKYMANKIFTLNEVGEYFNLHFINVAVQIDKTSKDSKAIQDWYVESDEVEKKFTITAYPSYLFFSADGTPLHKMTGISKTGDEFIAKASDAFDPEKQYFSLLTSWKEHTGDSLFLLNALRVMKNANDNLDAEKITNFFVKCLKEPVTKGNLTVIDPFITSENDMGFQLYLLNVGKINELADDSSFVEQKLGSIIFETEVAPNVANALDVFDWPNTRVKLQNKYCTLNKKEFASVMDGKLKIIIGDEINDSIKMYGDHPINWKLISKHLQEKYSGFDCGDILLQCKIKSLIKRKLWSECAKSAFIYIDRYSNEIDPKDINDISYDIIFNHSADRIILRRTLMHMALVIKALPDDVASIDTYANLLYKIGKKKEAIIWEEKAVSLAKSKNWDSSEFKEALAKMQNGTPTWKNS